MSKTKYSLSGFGSMLEDKIRIGAFTEALRRAIRPGAVVMDIGTGPGFMAILACRLGASRVYAIEPSEVIQLAREIAAANQCADKIEFYEALSTKITVPVRADVIVSDMRGILPLFESHIPSIADARKRFLTAGGTLIARRDRIWTAVVEAPKQYDKTVGPWERNVLGQDLTLARRKVLNEFQKVRMAPEDLLTAPSLWATLDYATIENPDVRGTLQWTAMRSGTGHGILVWFDMELADGVELSNGPSSPEAIYGSAFFPWLQPVPLAEGQRVSSELEAKLLEDEYFWRWTTQIASAENPEKIATRFEQSQLQGEILPLANMRKSASDFVPELSGDGLLRRRVLEMIDGTASLEKIARQLMAEFPERFAHWHKALSYAGAISAELSR
jgi:type I protein arginine methyltransferase